MLIRAPPISEKLTQYMSFQVHIFNKTTADVARWVTANETRATLTELGTHTVYSSNNSSKTRIKVININITLEHENWTVYFLKIDSPRQDQQHYTGENIVLTQLVTQHGNFTLAKWMVEKGLGRNTPSCVSHILTGNLFASEDHAMAIDWKRRRLFAALANEIHIFDLIYDY